MPLKHDVEEPDEQAEEQHEDDDRDRRATGRRGTSGQVTFRISAITA